MRALSLVLCLFVAASAAATETLTFEIYRLKADGGRELLANGTKQYNLADLEVSAHTGQERFWSKMLALTPQFGIGASVFRPKELIGFGLWVRERPPWYLFGKSDGFSWDWFNREDRFIYRKLQGTGRVNATILKGPDYEELTRVEFLDDVVLRLKESRWYFFSSEEDTHHVVVRKGSILQLAP